MRTLRIAPFILAFLVLVLPGSSSPAAAQSISAAEHNRKGLEYYNEAYYRHLPNGRQHDADESFELAVSEFKQAIAANPRSAEAHRNLARLYYVRRDFLQAADSYRTVTILDPRDTESYVQLALSYAELDRIPEAVRALESATDNTDNPEVIAKLDGYIAKLRQGK